MHRKLTPEQERQVCLEYLCGVDINLLRQKYDVCERTITGDIVNKRSREWNDPLVEHYRAGGARNRERNSAHLYLFFVDSEAQPTGLVDRGRDEPVYHTIKCCIYNPAIDGVIKATALEEYANYSNHPYGRFLNAIVRKGCDNEQIIVRNLLISELRKAYQTDSEQFSLREVLEEIKGNVVNKVRDGGLGWSKLKRQVIYDALNILKERERFVLGTKYGLNGYNGPNTLKQIGVDLGLGQERTRQIEAIALRRLRSHYIYEVNSSLILLTGLCTDADLEAHLKKVRYAREYDLWKNRLYSTIEQEVLRRATAGPSLIKQVEEEIRKEVQDKYPPCSVEELDLSVLTMNCLKNQDIKTIGELVQRTEADLLRVRNFGRKSLREIKEVLAKMGLALKQATGLPIHI